MPVGSLNNRVKWLCDENPRSRDTFASDAESDFSTTIAAAMLGETQHNPAGDDFGTDVLRPPRDPPRDDRRRPLTTT